MPEDHPLRPQEPPGVLERGPANPLVLLVTAPFRFLDYLYYRQTAKLEDECGSFAGGLPEEGLQTCGLKHLSFHFGSLGSKSGFWGLGFGLHNNLLTPTGLKFGLNAATTWRWYQEYDAYVGWNDPEKRPWVRLTGFYDRNTRDQFFGLGPDAPGGEDSAETDYSLETFGARFETGIPERTPFHGHVGARYEKSFVFAGENSDFDDTVDEFPNLAGVGPQMELWGPYANIVLDLTDAAGHPTQGVRLKGRGALWRSLDDQDFDWTTYGGEVQGHLPLGSEWHILSALAGFDTAEPKDDDGEIPFIYLPYLGGSDRLRGYETWRFQDRTAAYGTIEYRYRIWQEASPDVETASVIETAIFYDVGNVGEELDDIEPFDKKAYGFEFRAYLKDDDFFRVGLAHSEDGTRLNFKFSDIY